MAKILYLDHTASLGGGEIALLNLLTTLDRSRFEPIVVLASDGPLMSRLIEAGIETHLIPLDNAIVETRKESLAALGPGRLRQGTALVRYAKALGKFAREREIDLIHTNSLKADIYGGIAGMVARIPVIWHVRDHIDADYLPPLVAKVFSHLARIIPVKVIGVSESVLRRFTSGQSVEERESSLNGECVKQHWVAIHDGCKVEDFSDTDGLSESGQWPEAPVVTLVGRITPWKGQDILLQAAATIHARFPNVKFWIAGAPLFGEDDYYQKLCSLRSELGLEESVEFLGFCNDIPALLNRSNIVVHTSVLDEPFGQVLIEGMAAGKAIVATDCGAVPEIITDGLTGVLVPRGDHEALAQAIISLMESPDTARSIAAAARRHVREHFTIEQTAAKVEHLYDCLLTRDESFLLLPSRTFAGSATTADK